MKDKIHRSLHNLNPGCYVSLLFTRAKDTELGKNSTEFMVYDSERRECYTHLKFFLNYCMVFNFVSARGCNWNVQKSNLAILHFPHR